MCGIIGLHSSLGENVFSELVDGLFQLKHRGNDSFGIAVKSDAVKVKRVRELQNKFIKGFQGIAHNRLAITGHGLQPFVDEKTGIQLVHNGEIYNFKELKEELKEFNFSSDTDSEVILAFLSNELKKGNPIEKAVFEFMKKANGVYAVLFLFNESIYAFRDIIGEKPLWFGSNNAFTGICSEPKPLRKWNINFPQPLLPGHLLKVNDKVEVKKIFNLMDFKNLVPKTSSLEKLKNSLLDSVAFRCRELNQVGVFFSAGIDSTLIAKLVSHKVENTKLITVGLKDSEDAKLSEKIAKELGLDLSLRLVEKNELPFYVNKTLEHLPFFDQLQLQIGVVELIASEQAKKENIKVVFSGQGSDEVFCGYSNFKDVLKSKGFNGVQEEIWNSLENIWNRNLIREDLMAMANTIELRLPFLDLEFLKHAMTLPVKEKILSEKDELRKHVLRKLGKEIGLPQEVLDRKKKALQYGSGIGKEVLKLFSKPN